MLVHQRDIAVGDVSLRPQQPPRSVHTVPAQRHRKAPIEHGHVALGANYTRRVDQSDLDAYYMLGDMLMRREEYGQAVQLYGRLLKMEGVETERVQALLSAASRMLQQRQRV